MLEYRTVTLGILRFIGYEESRIMFEERTGKSAHEVMDEWTGSARKARRDGAMIWAGHKRGMPFLD